MSHAIEQASSGSDEAAIVAETPREIELKLDLPPALATDLLESPILRRHRVGLAARSLTSSVYYDFADGALARAGYTLRVRSEGPPEARRHTQTCKRTTAASGVTMDRPEWTEALPLAEPNLGLLIRTVPELAPLIGRRRRSGLAALSASHVDRITLALALSPDCDVEFVLDRGSVEAGGRRVEICQVELELKRGPTAPLFDLALDLHKRAPMMLTLESKSAMGERLRSGLPPAARRAEPPVLAPETTIGEAFRAVALEALGQLIANQPCVLGADPVEGVHQARVAIRRLRSAFALFLPNAEPGGRVKRAQADLRRRAALLGILRDWDVLATETLPRANKHGAAKEAVETLIAAIEAHRGPARIEVERLLRSPDHTKRMLRLARWLDAAPTSSDLGWAAPPSTRLDASAPILLERLRSRVLVRGYDFANLSEEARHEVRKAAKKLRYGIGFLAALYDAKAIKRYLKPLERLQEELGRLNDLATTHALFATLAQSGTPTALEVEAAIANHAQKRSAAVTGDWDAFAAAKPFWL